ncbi:MAG: toxin-antitoxin system HicB family antitoxin [Candidatus Zixiibacteriota bacterium]
MVTQNKDLEYYLKLDYDVLVARVEDDGEVMYRAYCRELDQVAFYGVGATKKEALESFELVRRELVPYYFENKIPIPEPEREDVAMPSGRFVFRTSPATHLQLIKLAKKNNQSLNSFVNAVMERFCGWDDYGRAVEAVLPSTASVKGYGERTCEQPWIIDINKQGGQDNYAESKEAVSA